MNFPLLRARPFLLFSRQVLHLFRSLRLSNALHGKKNVRRAHLDPQKVHPDKPSLLPNKIVMNGNTPPRPRDVIQVPSSSPMTDKSPPIANGTRSDDRNKADMKQRFYSHKFWPIISKRFYYLTEPELFKAMVKGKGNLRDISQWLSENIPLNERLQQYDSAQQAKRIAEKDERTRQQITTLNSTMSPIVVLPIADSGSLRASEPIPEISALASPANYGEEEESPVKAVGKARQKRLLSAMQPVAPAPDTKVQLQKPKVSILEKYRNRQQPKIDYMFQLNQPNEDAKRRRLIRADAMDAETPQASKLSAFSTPGLLRTAFSHNEDSVVKKSKSPLPEVDELEILEERIRANKKKRQPTRKTVHSDEDLEDDVFSDDMSAEEDDAYSTGLTSIDGQILDFLNQATLEDIIEICNITPKVAELLVAKRPFKSVYDVANDKFEEETPEPENKRKYQKKSLGLKIVESTEFSLKGYRAVDSLVKKCSQYGQIISNQMDTWGVKVTGEGELDMVDLGFRDGEDQPKTEEEDDDIGQRNKRSIPYVQHKPSLLSPDVQLKNYQQVGINWLNLLYHNKLSCILADEMGLGKTCQVIAFMAHLKATSDELGPNLVVVPASTLENWLREFQKFCPDLEVQAYYGSQAEREDLRYELMETEYDVLVTTYNLATGAPNDFKFLKSQKFDMIVYDEGHMLKNSNSERYTKLMRLKAKFRLLLTGTPLQNNLKELVSLLAFMLPDLFVEKREDLQGLFNKKASVRATGDYNPLLSQQAIKKAKTMMTPFVLRRKKAQVLKYLPGKTSEIVKCEMTSSQRTIYDSYIAQAKATKLERERRKTLTGKEAEEASKTPIPSSSNVMMSLRKASMHPLLFRNHFNDKKISEMAKAIMNEPQYVEANRDMIVEDMQVMNDSELNALCEKFPDTLASYSLEEEQWLDSGKVRTLLEIIKAVIERKEKILVFSLFTQMLDILEKVLSYASINFLRLDGQTSVDTRQDIIDRFYEDDQIPLFLLSTKAGGFGINLVAANNVVIFDQSFNPHDDKQAEDRAHRVGQEKEVLVTKLISEDTIDESILLLAENKLQLDQSISNETSEAKFEEKAASMFEKLLFEKK